FGEGLRNTIDLNGRAGMGQGPLHWSENFDEVQDFENQIRNLSGGTGLMSESDFAATQDTLGAPKTGRSADLDALAAYVGSLADFEDSPYRNGDGSLTSQGETGRALFTASNCAACHAGQNFTDSAPNSLHDIGTLKPTSGNRLDGPLTGIDTPTLRGIWSTAPYLHDGSATTLEEAVAAHSTLALSGGELTQLATYLRQIDGNEPGPTSNQPPVLTNPGVQSNAVGDSVNLPLSASDADGDSLTFSATGLPNGISINTGTGAIAGTATTAGSFDVTVSVNDGKGGIDSASFGWAVNAPANQPPVLINPGAQSNTVGDSVNLSLSASDADGDNLTFSATGLPNGISINTGTGAIAGTATTAGNFDVTLSVSDGKGGIDSATFTWMVIEQPVSSCGGLVQEAETATLYGDFAVVPDVNASGGQAIGVPVGVRAATTPDATQRVEFCVYVDTAGAYNLNALVYAPSNSSNSFYVQVDGQPTPAQRWNLATDENSYQLAVAPLTLNLAAGEHVITIL
ncbi:MAG: putative Ig domain-containing protein, partial [Caldilineaceae bacterium]|nr:putative Ig domain-containing protein [Caldilineaceae bacterium]